MTNLFPGKILIKLKQALEQARGLKFSQTYQNFYKPFWSGDYKLMKDEVYYYTNYVVIHSKGKYLMQVFPIDRLEKPLAFAFFVVN